MTTNDVSQAATTIMMTITGRSALSTEAWLFLACGGIGFLLVLRFAGAAFSFQRNTFITASAGSLLAAAIIGAALYAVLTFGIPHNGTTFSTKTLLLTSGCVVILAIVIPLFMLIYKTSYLRVALVVALAIAAAVGCTVLTRGAFRTFQTGNRSLDGAREHRKIIEEEAK